MRAGSELPSHPPPQLERKSLHSACPVIKGVKWSMPKWIHVGHYTMGDEGITSSSRQEEDEEPKAPSTHRDKDGEHTLAT